MSDKIQVTILDDHQSIIDGYIFRLNAFPNIEVAATISFAEELDATLRDHPTDVLLLDVSVPSSPKNYNPYPILHTIPQLLQRYSELKILIISMFAERGLIRTIMDAGASGYILKDDQATIRNLGNVIITVAEGGIYFSQKASELYRKTQTDNLLSPRQLEVLSLCLAYPDYKTAELAKKMGVQNSTVRNLLSSAYTRLGVQTRAAAITKAKQFGWITPEPPTVPRK
jgi:two-component system nitrate/nitrite response regulator NarL